VNLYWAGFFVALVVAPSVTRWFCKRLALERANFRGEVIPAAAGLTFLLVAVTGYALSEQRLLLIVSVGFGLLGLADDLWGDRTTGGFRGHLKVLFMGKPTTGSLKLVGGGLLALSVAWWRDRLSLALPVDALLIALAANTVNLLDLRPGRALFAFFLLATPTVFTVPFAILPPLLGALRECADDVQGRAMMGDTGANLLGAAAGLALVLVTPFWARCVALALLVALNIAAERVSFSALIAKTPWLNALDKCLGVR
jgi:UDP-N-acetylmuramyl pentapeptide phosphotransferase/UDP-N-acetylglucosamine-1-phosphate transferase